MNRTIGRPAGGARGTAMALCRVRLRPVPASVPGVRDHFTMMGDYVGSTVSAIGAWLSDRA